jgi:hypothetical protein
MIYCDLLLGRFVLFKFKIDHVRRAGSFPRKKFISASRLNAMQQLGPRLKEIPDRNWYHSLNFQGPDAEQQLFSRLHCTRCAITYITCYYPVPPANLKVKPGTNYGLATSPHHSDPARTPLSRGFLYLEDFLQPLVPIRKFDPGKEIENIDRDIRVYSNSCNARTLKSCKYIFPA